MKTTKYLSILILTLFFSACSDDDPAKPDSGLTIQQKIQNLWSLNYLYDINYLGQTNTVDYIDTFTIGAPGEYIDFRTDNKAYTLIDGDLDTADYKILSDTKMIYDEDTFTINTITSNELIMTYYDRISTDYYDNVIKLKR